MSSSWHGGKGDSSRTKNNVKYSNNWDSIFRTNQIIEGVEPTVKKKKTVFDNLRSKCSKKTVYKPTK